MNLVILKGNIGNTPETRTLDSGAKVAKFPLATNETWTKDGEKQTQTEWHKVIAWRKLADVVEKYTRKGSALLVQGKITYRTYENDFGEKKYYTEIIADKIELLDKAESKSGYFPTEEKETVAYATPEKDEDGDMPF